jgi:hypothetical protein
MAPGNEMTQQALHPQAKSPVSRMGGGFVCRLTAADAR